MSSARNVPATIRPGTTSAATAAPTAARRRRTYRRARRRTSTSSPDPGWGPAARSSSTGRFSSSAMPIQSSLSTQTSTAAGERCPSIPDTERRGARSASVLSLRYFPGVSRARTGRWRAIPQHWGSPGAGCAPYVEVLRQQHHGAPGTPTPTPPGAPVRRVVGRHPGWRRGTNGGRTVPIPLPRTLSSIAHRADRPPAAQIGGNSETENHRSRGRDRGCVSRRGPVAGGRPGDTWRVDDHHDVSDHDDH